MCSDGEKSVGEEQPGEVRWSLSSEVGVGVPWHMMCGVWSDLRLSFLCCR
jgi:hypothetical protein